MENYKTEVSGPEVFYIRCSLRTDPLGLAHMTNHSKFYLKVDSLRFKPALCDLPNEPTGQIRGTNDRFSFEKRKDLAVQLIVKVYSSWVNEAIMYTNDQQLGEFTINTKINKNDLNERGEFVYVYDGNEKKPKVTIEGESFIVPRSYVGSSQKSMWGTGQYRLDMVLTEQCSLNMDYYQEPSKDKKRQNNSGEHVGNAEQQLAKASPNDAIRWDKDVWKQEWKEMKSQKKDGSFWKEAGNAITTAYIGGNWIKEIVTPVTKILVQEETEALNKIVNLDELMGSGSQGMSGSVNGVGATGGAEMGAGQGTMENLATGNGQKPEDASDHK